jgi:hypothetical protein
VRRGGALRPRGGPPFARGALATLWPPRGPFNTIRPTQFNYPIDILGKWHGNRYRFVQRYRSGQPENLGEEFDAPFTRLDWISRDRFDLHWHRHTGTWFCLHRGLSLVEALKTIEADGLLHPL